MPNSFTIAHRPTSAPTSKPTLSKADAEVIAHARAELARTDKMLEEVLTLKHRLENFGAEYAAGKISMIEAAGLITASNSADARHDLANALRHPIKEYVRKILEGCAEVITKARQHAADELLQKCKALESLERDSAKNIGISADDYSPSGMLQSLREQHRRAVDTISHRITRQCLAQLP